MICGLEVQVSDELPSGYDFVVLEAPETERERIVRKAKAEVIREFAERLKPKLSYYDEYIVDALVEEMTEEHNESQNT
jgi:hypothetical protein